MKPSIASTALVFVLVGGAALLFGFAGFPKPTMIAGGVAAGAVGIGLFLRLRLAWSAGLFYSVVGAGLGGYRLYRAWTGSAGGVVLPAVWLALDLYLVLSLVVIRARFKRS